MAYEKIVDGIYYVGDAHTRNGLDCNSYIMVDGDDVILFDPGSNIEFDQIVKNIKQVVDLEKINYVVTHHQDPDVCSSIPLFEQMGLEFQIVTSWRTMTLIQYYGIDSEYYLLEENNYSLTLKSGRVLKFIQTPYLHFPGAFVTYDKKTQGLLSSDLFGAFSYNRTFYADETYLDKMITFHEHYMPSNSVLRPVMDVLLTHDIEVIMPQHGSIINKDIKKYINALRTLECGTLLEPIKKNLKASGGYLAVFNDIYRRYLSLYDPKEVVEVFGQMPSIVLEGEEAIKDYEGDPEKVWHQLFDVIKGQHGMVWIMVVEPHVRNICATYDLPIPNAMNALLQSAQMENKRLMEMTKALEETVQSVNEKLIKCSITGLYNETFFKSVLIEELDKEDWREIGAIVTIDVDNFSKYKLKFGTEEEESALKNIAYILKERFGENAVYRMDSTDFALYLKGMTQDEIVEELESLRIDISKSQLFLGRLTISLGVAFQDELHLDDTTFEMTMDHYLELSLNRLRIAKIKGKDYLCYESSDVEVEKELNSILLVDQDETNLEVMKTFIGELGVGIHIAKDGVEAMEKIGLYHPKLVITEVNLPKMDGFLLREQLITNSNFKDIDFVYLSHMKDGNYVKRANELGVMYYLRKPYLLSELIGIVKRSVKG